MPQLSLPRFAALFLLAAACGDSEANAPSSASPTDPATNPPAFGASDGGVTDDASCRTLNIGILGTPGEETSSNFQTWLANAGTSVKRVQTGRNDVLTAAVLAPFDVVVLDHLMHDYSAAEAETFRTWALEGKGVVSMTGFLDAPEIDWRANPLIRAFGVEYSGERKRNGPISQFAEHPITSGLTEVTFLGGYVVSETGTTTATRTALGRVPAGIGAYAVELDKARALVWGDEWIEFDSEWTTLPEIKQLWVQVFAWLAPKGCKLRPPA